MKSATHKKSKITPLLLLLIVFSILVSSVGCSRVSFLNNDRNEPSPPTDTPTPDDLSALAPADPTPQFYNRFTGLACDEAVSSCRPISICIGNFDQKQQEGLSFADILIEAPIERDQTRLWAITTNPSALKKISSVASVRDYMMPIANAFGGILAYAGTSDTVGTAAKPYSADTLDYVYHNLSETFQKKGEELLETSGDALLSAASGRGYSLTDGHCALPYSFPEVDTVYQPNSNQIRSVYFKYSLGNSIRFQYKEDSGLYLREQNGQAQIDPATEAQLAFSNLLLLFHNVNYYHTPSETTFQLDTQNGGEGYCYTGGGVLSVKWKFNFDGSLSITTSDGTPLTLNRGKTYIGMLRVTDSSSIVAQ